MANVKKIFRYTNMKYLIKYNIDSLNFVKLTLKICI